MEEADVRCAQHLPQLPRGARSCGKNAPKPGSDLFKRVQLSVDGIISLHIALTRSIESVFERTTVRGVKRGWARIAADSTLGIVPRIDKSA